MINRKYKIYFWLFVCVVLAAANLVPDTFSTKERIAYSIGALGGIANFGALLFMEDIYYPSMSISPKEWDGNSMWFIGGVLGLAFYVGVVYALCCS